MESLIVCLRHFDQNVIGDLESKARVNKAEIFNLTPYDGDSPLADCAASPISLIVNAVANCFSHCFNASTFFFM